MKLYALAIVITVALSSCLKESIADAILHEQNGGSGITASLSYQLNGTTVSVTVDDADNQDHSYYRLGCSKPFRTYTLDALTDFGETAFPFYTDTLSVGNYKYTGGNGEMFFLDYNNQAEYVYAPSDSMSLNITSYSNGHISGNFSGVLTPLVTAGTINNIFGDPSSIHITNGTFKNVPVFY